MQYEETVVELAEEIEVLEELGFHAPTCAREIGEPAPIEEPRRIAVPTTWYVGVFHVRKLHGEYTVTHRYGGLVPSGNGYAKSACFYARDEAMDAAQSWMDALLGRAA